MTDEQRTGYLDFYAMAWTGRDVAMYYMAKTKQPDRKQAREAKRAKRKGETS